MSVFQFCGLWHMTFLWTSLLNEIAWFLVIAANHKNSDVDN